METTTSKGLTNAPQPRVRRLDEGHRWFLACPDRYNPLGFSLQEFEREELPEILASNADARVLAASDLAALILATGLDAADLDIEVPA